MNFQFNEKEEKLRAEIREFVKNELPPGFSGGAFEDEHDDDDWDFAMSIAQKLAKKGWLTINWPKEYGGMGASLWEQVVYAEEVGYWRIPGTMMGVSGVGWVGPSLIMFGSEEQKKKYMPLIAAGDPDGVWCTGYSEPDAGSDFANIRTRAERKGDEYIINGQKVWTSAAHRSRWCWLAVKTDANAKKKHHGISIIIVDMKSPGVTVRPIINYVGYHIFNEVFFDNVRVPAENLVGQENRGWYQLMQSLMYERGSVAIGAYGACKRILDELIHFAREKDLLQKQQVRQKLADITTEIESLKMLAYQTIWVMTQGNIPITEPSRDKALTDMLMEKLSIIGSEVIGAYSQIDPLDNKSAWAINRARIEKSYWMFPGIAIAAGTTDTQRNIVGQFGLELPKSY
ncbi:MAG: acyl-CoA dehydrogenase family protein [Spirochaetota bacterium]|nr:acyl-CoA dehydrogenase family protein [Spirochaetota bacterium]